MSHFPSSELCNVQCPRERAVLAADLVRALCKGGKAKPLSLSPSQALGPALRVGRGELVCLQQGRS